MPNNLPISGLPTLTGADLADGDLFESVDVSDPTNDPAGTNKQIPTLELAGRVGRAGRVLAVDAVNGNDATAARGSPSRPFLTPAAAQTAANAGDNVTTYPGTHALAAPLGKGGVNWTISAGTTLAAVVGEANFPAVGDGGAAMTFRVVGRGTLGLDSGNPGGAMAADGRNTATVEVLNAASDVRVECERVTLSAGSIADGAEGWTVRQAGGTCHIVADLIDTTSAYYYSVIDWENGEMHVRARVISAPAGASAAGPAVLAAVTAAPTGGLYVQADHITAGGAAVSSTSTQAEAKVWAAALLIEGSGGTVNVGGGKVYVTAEKVADNAGVGNVSGPIVCTGGQLWVTAQKLTGNYGSGIVVSGGTAYVTCQQIEDLGHLTQAVKVTGGTLHLFDAVIAPATGDGVVCTGGTVYLHGCTIRTAGAAKDLKQSGAGQIVVCAGTTGSNADGSLTSTGAVTYEAVVTNALSVPGPNGTYSVMDSIISTTRGTLYFNYSTARNHDFNNGQFQILAGGTVAIAGATAGYQIGERTNGANLWFVYADAGTIRFYDGGADLWTLARTTGVMTVAGQVRCASLGVGNAVAATTPGAVVKKFQLFDAAGNSVGWIPVYNAIT